LVAIGTDRIVCSVVSDMHFFSHKGGREVNLVRRIALAHASTIHDMAVYGDRVATTSHNGTVRVWSSQKYELQAVLRRHEDREFGIPLNGRYDWEFGIRMDARYIVTFSSSSKMRV
jgi:WD40 repeat protein